MDNLPRHKRASVREPIEAARAQLKFLAPYSPNFNPIDKDFSRLKAMPRKAGDRPIMSGPWPFVGKHVGLFEARKCANYVSSRHHDPD